VTTNGERITLWIKFVLQIYYWKYCFLFLISFSFPNSITVRCMAV
jgi:hypothetical protein